ncbi:ATP synthase subunit D [Marinitoga sp. 1135]|uniref:V-type ATP synthase subunit D n=1 Tax=Marinitoga piezophila (strain DSM 14283 / JCM 11233 / KA3) TaxID=443254 RepID=H2J5L5_MARPK|nr:MULTISPECIES: V-type ATP synthase subunit D [Marinitoga]AEX85001.1 H(+)-transporting ATP synthase, vacuolar type, subunit D [Marinitoga piezophila KA3]APT75505.1 ATP synthase subunit D [Marinitoga sp. 1137]NUU95227.1 ATP synthase subunit D [Marinitoga sp. 1135]NUU97160.1 ATP synthase subunit D [Marinitoga sp. 1138]
MIFNQTIPTKGNLINLKQQYKLAKQGHDLLEKKRNIIMKELVDLIEQAQEIQERILKIFEIAYESLQLANLDLGIENVEQYAKGVPEFDGMKIRFRSIMGVEVPEIYKNEKKTEIPYEIYRTDAALDKAYISFKQVLELITEAAMIENKVYKLAYEVKKTKKRVSALENVVIPQLQSSIKFIQDTLEEFEREEFFKLKKLKK